MKNKFYLCIGGKRLCTDQLLLENVFTRVRARENFAFPTLCFSLEVGERLLLEGELLELLAESEQLKLLLIVSSRVEFGEESRDGEIQDVARFGGM